MHTYKIKYLTVTSMSIEEYRLKKLNKFKEFIIFEQQSGRCVKKL